jgi:ATP adenylyltransferase
VWQIIYKILFGDQMTLKNNSEGKSECFFCSDIFKKRIIEETDMYYAVKDDYPVTEGHLLVIPKRHVAEYFDLSDEERRDADNLMKYLYHNMVKNDPTITRYNIGVNCGYSAGQSIFHLHYHLIPRRDGDTENPRGGVRGVIPGKRSY